MGRVTINMIAEAAGVSRGTVDRVLNNRSYVKAEVREKVLQTAREMGYVSLREQHQRELEAENCPLRLGVVLPGWGFGQQFRDGVLQGIREAQEELGNANVEILIKQCRTDLPEEAVELLEELRGEGAQGLSVCLLRDPATEEKLRELTAAGILVVTFNSDLPESGRLLFVGQDLRRSGRLAAQIMHSCIRPGEQVLAAVGNMKFDGHRQRYMGFAERMGELGFPEEDLFTVETFNDYGTTLREVGRMLRIHPGLGGIYMANLNVPACAEAVRAYGLEKKVHVVAHDINDGIRRLLRDGRVDFTIPQDFVRQGREPLFWLASHLRNKELPDAGRFKDLQILCAENL